MTWNTDISAAPRGNQVTVTRKVKTDDGHAERNFTEHHVAPLWLATKDGKVHRSYWIPATKTSEGRWAGFSVGSELPIAWQPFIVPEHPFNPVTAISQEARTPFGGAEAVTESGAGEAITAGPAISIIDDVGGE